MESELSRCVAGLTVVWRSWADAAGGSGLVGVIRLCRPDRQDVHVYVRAVRRVTGSLGESVGATSVASYKSGSALSLLGVVCIQR